MGYFKANGGGGGLMHLSDVWHEGLRHNSDIPVSTLNFIYWYSTIWFFFML